MFVLSVSLRCSFSFYTCFCSLVQVWWGAGYEQWYNATVVDYLRNKGAGLARLVYDMDSYTEVRNILVPSLTKRSKKIRMFTTTTYGVVSYGGDSRKVVAVHPV